MNPGPHRIEKDLTIQLSDDGKVLQALFPAASQRPPIKLAWLKEKLDELGFSALSLDNNAIGSVINQYNDGKADATINIGECVDGELRLKISDDQMRATLSLRPACGGKPVTREMINEAMQEYGIRFGILEKTIEEALQKGEVHECVIVEGSEAQHGKDGYFKNLIPDLKDRRPRIDDKGRAHYNDIVQFVIVKPGDKLVKRIPATKGTPGRNIRDIEVPAQDGAEIMFAANLYGVDIDPENPDTLIATIHGQPVLVEGGCMVEPTIVVDSVDMNTGNIEFEGTVTVKGNVTTGMMVRCSGDLQVQGMIEEASVIEVGGDLVVAQGIIGRGVAIENNGNAGKGAVNINCSGKVSAKFIENSFVRAQKKIEVAELIAHCDISSSDSVIVGHKGTKRGHIMGGATRAEMLIQAEVLGSPAAVHTKIEVGVCTQLLEQIKSLNGTLEAKKTERIGVETALMRLVKKPQKDKQKAAKMQQRIKATLEKLSEQTVELEQQKSEISAEIERLAGAKVVLKRQAFSAVEITIGEKQQRLDRETSPGSFQLRDDNLIFIPG